MWEDFASIAIYMQRLIRCMWMHESKRVKPVIYNSPSFVTGRSANTCSNSACAIDVYSRSSIFFSFFLPLIQASLNYDEDQILKFLFEIKF